MNEDDRAPSPKRQAEDAENPHGSAEPGQNEDNHGVTEEEMKDVEERSSPRTPVIYEIVRKLGEEEMARPLVSLWWSGVAAGISITFSLIAQSILQIHLPDASWRPLITSAGYSVGFLIVVLSRQQLFTENTITAVLPVMADFSWRTVCRMGRLWSIVLIANLAGTLTAAVFCTFVPVLTPEVFAGMIQLSHESMAHGATDMLLKAIPAGFIIAAMVWLIPSAEGAQFHVIALMSYLVAAGGFAHIVVGSAEAFLLAVNGQMGIWPVIASFIAPVLIGNVIGGTVLFALISYAQVMAEI
jgi:formate/nitrite transporter FocA (FNT family)